MPVVLKNGHSYAIVNSIVVAAIEGNPTFFAVDLAADPRFEMLSYRRFMDAFGVLRFDTKKADSLMIPTANTSIKQG